MFEKEFCGIVSRTDGQAAVVGSCQMRLLANEEFENYESGERFLHNFGKIRIRNVRRINHILCPSRIHKRFPPLGSIQRITLSSMVFWTGNPNECGELCGPQLCAGEVVLASIDRSEENISRTLDLSCKFLEFLGKIQRIGPIAKGINWKLDTLSNPTSIHGWVESPPFADDERKRSTKSHIVSNAPRNRIGPSQWTLINTCAIMLMQRCSMPDRNTSVSFPAILFHIRSFP
jgi:hypothetical protein